MRAVRQLSEHFNKPPDQLTEEQLRDCFLYPEKLGSRNGRAPRAPSPFAASSSSTKKR
jgi:hypothetical protein